jgi:hypothetical protein
VAEAVHQQEVVPTTRVAALLHLSTHDGREDVNRQRKLTEKKAGILDQIGSVTTHKQSNSPCPKLEHLMMPTTIKTSLLHLQLLHFYNHRVADYQNYIGETCIPVYEGERSCVMDNYSEKFGLLKLSSIFF